MSGLVPKHGLTRNTKRQVFDALLQRQQGKCAICGISQDALVAKAQKWADLNPRHAERAMLPVHTKLFIDHCHWTGRIRGLLCPDCNTRLGGLENYAFREKPEDLTEWDFTRYCYDYADWLVEHWEPLFAYMQYDRWLPTKDILFHLHEVSNAAAS